MDNMQETFNCMMSWSPAQVLLYAMHEDICRNLRDRIDPKSGMFPDKYYEDMRVVAQTFGLKFTDPRGVNWAMKAREGNITVH